MAAGVSLGEVWDNVWRSRKTVLSSFFPSALVRWDLMEVKQRWRRGWESAWEGENVDEVEKPTGRNAYFSALTCCLLSCREDYSDPQEVALQALFCVPGLERPSPSSIVYSRFELLNMLVQYQCQPPVLELSCSCFMELGLWDRKEEVFSLLSVLFSSVSLLEICEHESCFDGVDPNAEQLSLVFRYLLEAVFCDSKKRPNITRFTVTADDEEFLIGAFHHMADIMSSRPTCGLFTRDLYTHYDGLRLLAVYFFMENKKITSLHDPNIDLRMVIEYQTALHSLYIQGVSEFSYGASPEYDQLMECFSSLFRKPTFFRLGLCDFCFLHSSGNGTQCFEDIMHKFLCSPVRGQELELSGVWELSLERCSASYVSLLDQPPSSVCGSKSLRIMQDVPCSRINPRSRLPVFPLSSLGYLSLDHLDNLTADTLEAIATLNLTALEFESCLLSNVVPSSTITQLFTMPNLTSLTLENARVPATATEQFMETVTQGLLHQASLAKITLLNLNCNGLAKMSSRHLRDLFYAIFNLPQLESFTLLLRFNYFTESHMQLLCQSWCEEAGGRRLLELQVCKQFLHHPDEEKMTHTCTPELMNLAVTVPCTFSDSL